MENIKPDFHAKPEIHVCPFGNYRLFHEKDVLAEREHYQKEIEYWKDQDAKWLKENERMTEVNRSFIKRAEVAEKETIRLNGLLMTADGVKETLAKRAEKAEARAEAAEKKAKDFEDAAGAMSAELTEFGERAEKAEARVEKLTEKIKEISKLASAHPKTEEWHELWERLKEISRQCDALAGEKTK